MSTRETLVQNFAAARYDAISAGLPALLDELDGRGASACWHKHGTFRAHLVGVYRSLRLWGQPEEIARLGLLHSAYSNEFVDLALFDRQSERGRVANLVGREVEGWVHEFCVMPRRTFTRALVDAASIDDADRQGVDVVTAAIYAVVTMADLAEQWFDWQDRVLEGYFSDAESSLVTRWDDALWPGPFAPARGVLHVVARLGAHVRASSLPTPPIFEHCSRVLGAPEEARASALYARVVIDRACGGADEAADSLGEAHSANPFIAEPALALAQLRLAKGEFSEAGALAAAARERLVEWGTPFDKRIDWNGWLAWASVLEQCARDRTWPSHRAAHNNLGLVLRRTNDD